MSISSVVVRTPLCRDGAKDYKMWTDVAEYHTILQGGGRQKAIVVSEPQPKVETMRKAADKAHSDVKEAPFGSLELIFMQFADEIWLVHVASYII